MVSGGLSNQQQQQQQHIQQPQNNSQQQVQQQQQVLQQQQQPSGQSGINGNNPSNNIAGSNGGNNGSNAGLVGGGTSAAAAKNQLEQLNTMREALFSQDGWGCQHVNQDTNWDVPGSPEPANKDPTGGPQLWKPNINNGTDLWEANLRNGGQPPPQPVQKTPWGHTPTSNLGGTWGEDDDGTDASNVWTGAPANSGGNPGGGGSGVVAGGGLGRGESGGPLWGAPPGNNTGAGGNGAGTGAATNAWGDLRDMRQPSIDIRNVDPREIRTPSVDPREIRMIDPREQIRDMRGDPRGISGRLNGNSELWGQHHAIAHGQMPLNKMVGPGVNPTAVVTGSGVVGGSNNSSSQWGAGGGGQPGVSGPKDAIAMAAAAAAAAASGGGVNNKQSGWEEPSPPPQRRNLQNFDDGTTIWGQQTRISGGSGPFWKDIDASPRNIISRSAIGAGANQSSGNPGGINPGGIGAGGVGPMPQGRLIGGPAGVGPGGPVKPDNMWGHAGIRSNNGNWDDQHGGGNNWDEKPSSISALSGGNNTGGSWNDATSTAWNKNPNKLSSTVAGSVGQSWPETNELGGSDWGAPPHGGVNKSQNKLMNNELLRNSKQYRMLTEMGYKKEDVEIALRASNLSFEDAIDILNVRNNPALDTWRHSDGSAVGNVNTFDHSGGFPGRFPSGGPPATMPFPPSNNPNLLNNIGAGNIGGNPSLSAINNMQPLQVQKYPNQGPHNVAGALANAAQQQQQSFGGNGPGGVVGVGGSGLGGASVAAGNHQSGQPSAQQLRMLVQQIQMAVQGGYLSSQILNQPLAPATLILLNQLLSNIKHLQGAQNSIARNPNINNLQVTLAITKFKQQITQLQNQINAQQTIYIKQQHLQQQQQQQQQAAAAAAAATAAAVAAVQSHGGNTAGGGNTADYLRGQHDAISALQGNFSEINLKEQPGAFQTAPNQSRLTQWKLPVLEKDNSADSTDFSRAPGPTAKPITSNANNVNTLGLQGDGTWSSARNMGEGWPDSTNENENKDWPAAQPSPATAFTDLVPEFEPGKPWKGSQIKSIEDDPSITPGSVARSPLSINPTPKDADIFASSSKTSPTDLPPLSLSSSTWSFNPSGSQPNFAGWSDNGSQQSQSTVSSELWGSSSMNKTSRGPPPGLGANKSVVGGSGNGGGMSVSGNANIGGNNSGNSNGWIGSGLSGRTGGGPSGQTNWSGGGNSNWNSTWLLLKNLTTQIDGSTLRTLCMQHGPLLNFHLYLTQGIALCKYSTREEANKAQMTLNNCVLGNTTICAESPNESEVQNIVQHFPASSGGPSQTGGSNSGVGLSANVSGGVMNLGGGNVQQGLNHPWRPQNQQTQGRAPTGADWGPTVWPGASVNSWPAMDGATERGTPSNLKSFLPENLLELN